MIETELFAREMKFNIELANPALASTSDIELRKEHSHIHKPWTLVSWFEVVLDKEVALCGCPNCFSLDVPFDLLGDLKVETDLLVSTSYRDRDYRVCTTHDFDLAEDLEIRQLGLRINSRFIRGYDVRAPSCELSPKPFAKSWESGGCWIVKPNGEMQEVARTRIC